MKLILNRYYEEPEVKQNVYLLTVSSSFLYRRPRQDYIGRKMSLYAETLSSARRELIKAEVNSRAMFCIITKWDSYRVSFVDFQKHPK